MIILNDIKKNPQISEFIRQTEKALSVLAYTDHGFRHSNLTSDRAKLIAKEIGLSKKEQELSAIAAYCHDMGNFLSRTYHNYFGAMLFHQVFQNDFKPKELIVIMQALSNHDKEIEDVRFMSSISAVVVLADKSDVHRSRVTIKKMKKIKTDIHDRVNYATIENDLRVNKKKKTISLVLRIDTKFVPVMEYFEIFTDRMVYCRQAAKYLGYKFGLVINKFRLL